MLQNALVTTATTASFLPQIHAANENPATFTALNFTPPPPFFLPPPPIEWLERDLSEPKLTSEFDEFAEFSERSESCGRIISAAEAKMIESFPNQLNQKRRTIVHR